MAELERAALGQADTEVQRRVTSDKEWLIRLSSDASARAEAFERYVDNVVARIAEGSRAVSLLLAREVIGGWRPPGNAQIVRAPLALRLVVRLANESVDVGAP